MFRVLRAGSISSHGMRILSSFSETSPVFKKYKGGLGEKNASKVSSSLVAKCGLYLQSHFYTSVEVKSLYEDDHAAGSIAREDGPNDGDVLLNCVKLKGMPYETTQEDVMKFFRDLSTSIKGIYIMGDAKTEHPNGSVYVHLVDEDSAFKAENTLDKDLMGSHLVRVFVCSNYITKHVVGNYALRKTSTNIFEGVRNLTSYTIIKARGIPYNAKLADILDFFADFNVQSNNIDMRYRGYYFLGTALVGFPSPEEAKKAVKELNRKHIGLRCVELEY